MRARLAVTCLAVASIVTAAPAGASVGPADPDGLSTDPAISADGRFVAFVSEAENLAGPANGLADVFLVDRQTGSTTAVSTVPGTGAAADGASFSVDISADGRYVVFDTAATNLVPGDENGQIDVLRYDAQIGDLVLVSRRGSAGVQGDGASSFPTVSGDGSLVAFTSQSTNLVGGDTNGKSDAFVRDVAAGTTTRVSTDANGRQAKGLSDAAVIADGGKWIQFTSTAANLVGGDSNRVRDVFLNNLATGKVLRVSVRSNGTQANGASSIGDLSADGTLSVFSSLASNLVNDTNNTGDVFLHDRVAKTTVRLSRDGSTQGNDQSFAATISADGTSAAFQTWATNLVPGPDGNGADADVLQYAVATKTLVRISIDQDGGWPDGPTFAPALDADGSVAAFASLATDLVMGDGNAVADVFAFEWTDPGGTAWAIERVSEVGA
jgi:Tol biopolymer transport system component